MRSLYSPRLLTGAGLVVAVCGLLLFLNGVGTALHFMYGQSHPVAPRVAFSLEIEHTVGGALLLVAGCGIAVRNWLR
ncbi:hypothetical protein [Haloferax sp. DFSO60]|uniref:hypothetical protein n=1 Tax=Haloferax sp. DFSO60 TaxID=3388652 RepID=UPI00397A36EF